MEFEGEQQKNLIENKEEKILIKLWLHATNYQSGCVSGWFARTLQMKHEKPC